MSSESETTIRRQDVDAVAEKLAPFIAALPDQERNVLGWIMARAKAAGELEPPPPELTPPLSSSLAEAAGFGDATEEVSNEITGTVGWKHSF